MKIYVVIQTLNEGYRVIAATANKEKADSIARGFGDPFNVHIEEFCDGIPTHIPSLVVTFGARGSIDGVRADSIPYSNPPKIEVSSFAQWRGSEIVTVNVPTRNRSLAVKTAREARAKYLKEVSNVL